MALHATAGDPYDLPVSGSNARATREMGAGPEEGKLPVDVAGGA